MKAKTIENSQRRKWLSKTAQLNELCSQVHISKESSISLSHRWLSHVLSQSCHVVRWWGEEEELPIAADVSLLFAEVSSGWIKEEANGEKKKRRAACITLSDTMTSLALNHVHSFNLSRLRKSLCTKTARHIDACCLVRIFSFSLSLSLSLSCPMTRRQQQH
jgi:hypothetical protein